MTEWICPHCGLRMLPRAHARHEPRCRDASPGQRAYYDVHRTWPSSEPKPTDKEIAMSFLLGLLRGIARGRR